MLQSQRNKQTLEILKRLRQQGAPRQGQQGITVSLDMVPPDGEEEEEFPEGAEPGEPSPDSGGTLAELDFPSVGLPKQGKKRKKREDEDY